MRKLTQVELVVNGVREEKDSTNDMVDGCHGRVVAVKVTSLIAFRTSWRSWTCGKTLVEVDDLGHLNGAIDNTKTHTRARGGGGVIGAANDVVFRPFLDKPVQPIPV